MFISLWLCTVDYSTRGVRLFWIFPGAPWNFNGVRGNTWGSIDVYWYNTFHKCFWFLVLLNLTHVIFLNMYWIMLVCCISHLLLALPWRHNGHDSVSNHQRYDCLLNRLSDADQRKHQSPASLAFVREIHRGPVNFPHKWPVTRKMFPFDDVIMRKAIQILIVSNQIVTNRRIAIKPQRNLDFSSSKVCNYTVHTKICPWFAFFLGICSDHFD